MKRCFQLVALLAVVLLGSCTGGKDKSAAEKTEEKPKVKLADVTARPIQHTGIACIQSIQTFLNRTEKKFESPRLFLLQT